MHIQLNQLMDNWTNHNILVLVPYKCIFNWFNLWTSIYHSTISFTSFIKQYKWLNKGPVATLIPFFFSFDLPFFHSSFHSSFRVSFSSTVFKSFQACISQIQLYWFDKWRGCTWIQSSFVFSTNPLIPNLRPGIIEASTRQLNFCLFRFQFICTRKGKVFARYLHFVGKSSFKILELHLHLIAQSLMNICICFINSGDRNAPSRIPIADAISFLKWNKICWTLSASRKREHSAVEKGRKQGNSWSLSWVSEIYLMSTSLFPAEKLW